MLISDLVHVYTCTRKVIHFTLKIEPSEFSYKQITIGHKNDVRLLGVYFLYSLSLAYWPPCKHMSTAFKHGESHLGEYRHLSLPRLLPKFSKYILIMPFVTCVSVAFDSGFKDL